LEGVGGRAVFYGAWETPLLKAERVGTGSTDDLTVNGGEFRVEGRDESRVKGKFRKSSLNNLYTV